MVPEKNNFIFYTEWRDCFAILSPEEQSRLLMALIDYQTTGEVPELDGAVLMAFTFIKKPMDQNRKKYADKCERSKANGEKGGRPPKTQQPQEKATEAEETQGTVEETQKTQWVSSEPKKADSESDSDSVSVSESVSERERDKRIYPPISPDGDISPQGDAPAPSARKKKPEKKAYGQFGKVRLTEEEHTKLVQQLGKDEATALIDDLDSYVASKGKKYASHYATLLNWWRKDHPKGGVSGGRDGTGSRGDPSSPWNRNLV